MVLPKQLLVNAFRLLFIVTIIAKLLDTYKSSNFVETHFIVSSDILIVFTLAVALLLRLQKISLFSPFFVKIISYAFTPLFIGAGLLFIILDQVYFVNFIYSKLFIQMTEIVNLGLFFLIICFISLSDKWYKRHFKPFLFWSPLIAVLIFWIYGFLPFSARQELGKEDGFIENLSAISMFISAYLAGYMALLFYRKKQIFLTAILFFASLGSFFIAAEEISWGQRIFNIQSPQFIMETNTQGEINIHNRTEIAGLAHVFYMVIGLYGALAWIPVAFVDIIKKVRFLTFIIPQWFLFTYFFLTFSYQGFLRKGEFFLIRGGEWSEFSELLLCLGIMLHFIYVYMIYKPANAKYSS